MLLSAVVLVTTFTSQVLGGPLLGANKCNWGPSYWCANIPQASECKAVHHCIGAVWSKETLPQDDDEVCEVCKEMVGEARDTLMSNETQEELKEVLEGSCNLIPIGIIAKECRVLADQFAVELVETLASEMNPVQVCTVAGLCNSGRIDRMLEKLEMKGGMQYGGDCNICRQGARKTKNQLKSLSQDQVEDKMLELCGYLSSFSDACRAAVMEESDRIYLMLTTQFDEEICDLSGLCSQALEKVPATVLVKQEDLQCEFCEKVIKHWIDVYASNASLAEFKDLLDGICEKLDKSNAVHCKHVVDQYYIPFFEFLRNEVDPHTVCSMVGLCGSGGFMQVGQDVPLSLLSRSKVPVATPLVKLKPATPVKTLSLSDSKCEMCDMVMTEVFSFLQDKSDQRMVKNVLETICYRLPLPTKYERKCEDFMEKYTSSIVEFIVNGLEPEEICSAISLCGRKMKIDIPSPQKPAPKSSPKPDCILCEYVINTVDKMLKNKDDEAEIKETLEKVCGYLPSSLSKQCDTFVETYTEIIIDMLIQDVSPEMVCTNLGLCPGIYSVLKAVPVTKDQAPSCVLCEYVINTVDKMLEDEANEKQIEEALESVCSYLPGSISKQCNTFVEAYTAIIIDMLTKDVSPEMVCTNLGLCPQSFSVTEQISDLQLDDDTQPPGCVLCEYVIDTVDKMLADKANEKQIEAALESVCSFLPSSLTKQCNTFVDAYTEIIIDMLTKDVSPEMVCTNLGLCKDTWQTDIMVVEEQIEEEDSPQFKDPYCTLCEVVVQDLENSLGAKKTQAAIEQALDVLCTSLSAPVHKECEKMITKYTEEIVELFLKDYSAKEICTELGLCVDNQINSNDISAVEFEIVDTSSAYKDEVGCEMCEFAMTVIDEHLKDPGTVDQLEREVQFVCSFLPDSISDKCEEFVDKYGEKVVDALVDDEMDPKEVCSELLPGCEAKSLEKLSKCPWGPEYYCASPFHANICGTTKFCQMTGQL